MKNAYQFAMAMATAALFAVLLLAPAPSRGQAPAPANADDKAKAARAKRIAQQFEAQARVLTVFDRQGNVVTTVGGRAVYVGTRSQLVFSPDRTRLAVIKKNLESGDDDLWVLDVATGNSTQITCSQTLEAAWAPPRCRR